MTFQEFKTLITDISENQTDYYTKLADFYTSPHIGKFRPTFDVIFSLFDDIKNRGLAVVKILNLQQAFANNGTTADDLFLKKLLGSIEKNPPQWENAFEQISGDKQAALQTELYEIELYNRILLRKNSLLKLIKDADWKAITELPTDKDHKLVYVFVEPFYYKLSIGKFDPDTQQWLVDNEPDGKFKIIEWTSINALPYPDPQ